MEGFGTFRSPTVVDFTDVDLFALTGPTGSGKTTVLDAMCFALYGSIPRYDDRRLVAPAISQGSSEARVRLDFEVAGERCTAVRVVRRTKTGATTKEARLERSTGVVAGNEKEVTAAVEAVLGLTFEHFTTCVVLPQGEFARFLHDKPERRQDLLVNLLDLRVYERMGEFARTRAAAARSAAHVHEARLAALAGATPEAEAEAHEQVELRQRLLALVDEVVPQIAAHTAARDAAESARAAAAARAARLRTLDVPPGVADLSAALEQAEAAVVAAQQDEAAAEAAATAAEAALAALPARAGLERAEAAYARRDELEAQRVKAEPIVAELAATDEKAAARLAEAEAAVVAAGARLEAIRGAHRAHAVAADLVLGEPCPACLQTVRALPTAVALPALDEGRDEVAAAESAAGEARRESASAQRERMRVEETVASIQRQLAELDGALADAPSAADVAAGLAAVAQAETVLARASEADRAARRHTISTGRHRDERRAEEAEQRRAFDAARDALAALEPPPRTGESLAADWADLARWAAETAPILEAEAAAAAGQVADAAGAAAALEAALSDACTALDIRVGARNARDAVVDDLTRAHSRRERLAEERAEAAGLRTEVERLDLEQQLHGALAGHLSARGFEKWLLDEALAVLLEGATDLLLELSGGQYSLVLDDKRAGFSVVDHRNAGEQRLARSLSGGETFLASLALALALADRLALLAQGGGVRLESMFLDEGFGTLDSSTLDTVAAAIEALGARGRMVGVITHVPELAERMPVRFEVARGPSTSTVTRFDR
jgi:exonuclease SbcC